MRVTANMENNNKKKVLVALSGGVDSSVCVHLLKQDYDVYAVVLKMSPAHDDTVNAAIEAAKFLDIPLTIKDMQAEFEREVIAYFVDEYKNGRTPNPCIFCNPKVKFKALIDTANELDCDLIATGHYARLETQSDYTHLLRGECLKRDQSYMLYRLPQSVLSRLVFPLAALEKTQVREIAAELNLPCAKKPDSQENCFIPDNDYAKYVEGRIGKLPQGDIIAPDKTVCGRHNGIIHYTVGQRKGLGVALGRPVFVKEINAQSNCIYLADLCDNQYQQTKIHDIATISGKPFLQEFGESFKASAKIRSMAVPVAVTVIPLGDSDANVIFDIPQTAVANGQSLVLYDGDYVLGGGIIAAD